MQTHPQILGQPASRFSKWKCRLYHESTQVQFLVIFTHSSHAGRYFRVILFGVKWWIPPSLYFFSRFVSTGIPLVCFAFCFFWEGVGKPVGIFEKWFFLCYLKDLNFRWITSLLVICFNSGQIKLLLYVSIRYQLFWYFDCYVILVILFYPPIWLRKFAFFCLIWKFDRRFLNDVLVLHVLFIKWLYCLNYDNTTAIRTICRAYLAINYSDQV